VSDVDRERVAVALREHCVAGRLTLEEFSERTDRVLEARTRAELDGLMTDLAEPESARSKPIGSKTSVMIIGGLERKGRWRLAERLRLIGLIGGAELDLTDAVIEAETTVIDVWWAIGGLDITVPEGIEVEIGGFTMIGGVENASTVATNPGAPRILLRQFALIGGTSITVRQH
jgi:hypothetical protein